jgi:hypothetical protein
MLALPLLIDRNVSWRAWFRSAGLKLDRDIVGTSFTDANSLMEAAVTGHCARVLVCHTIGYSGGKARSVVRTQLARFLLPLRCSSDLFRVHPSPVGLPGLAGRRGPSFLGGTEGPLL